MSPKQTVGAAKTRSMNKHNFDKIFFVYLHSDSGLESYVLYILINENKRINVIRPFLITDIPETDVYSASASIYYLYTILYYIALGIADND